MLTQRTNKVIYCLIVILILLCVIVSEKPCDEA